MYLSLARLLATLTLLALALPPAAAENKPTFQQARWDPIHFKPLIDQATDQQCLECHADILERKPLPRSPAGVDKDATLAWYQTLSVYEGEQETFHRRHMVTPLAREQMDFHCNTCHQGYNPDRETWVAGEQRHRDAALVSKDVDPQICLMCHGRFDYQVMPGLTAPWTEIRERFHNNCLACHRTFRTNRHKLNFLKAEAIEKAGERNGDTCYGCHGGRAWYAIAFPYVRRPWPRMPSMNPEWAPERPAEYDPRFTRKPTAATEGEER